MASYPGAVKAFTVKNAGDTIQPADVNDLQDEVNAIEAGILNGTAPLNSSNSTVVHLSVTAGLNVVGNSTFGSSVTFGTLPYIFPASGGSSGQALFISSTSGSTMTLAWGSVGAVSLVYANSGQSSAAGAATVDSTPLPTLTAKDHLLVTLWSVSATQATAGVGLYSVTDAVFVSAAQAISAGQPFHGTFRVAQDPISSTQISTYNDMYDGGTGSGRSASQITGLTTPWTGTWTLGLRHGGVGAGGTLRYRWSVYRVVGQ